MEFTWVVEHDTTPLRVHFQIEDPTRTIILDEEDYPGDSGLSITRYWTIPGGTPDGKYWARVEYWSFEAGNEANAEVTFYVCGDAGEICAVKWGDTDCDSSLTASDTPLEDWWICLRTPWGDTSCMRTDPDGRACWYHVPLGDYSIFEILVDGWYPIYPASYEFTLTDWLRRQPTEITFFNGSLDFCRGACCFPDGSCAEVLGSECAAGGGEFLGVGLACDDVVCVVDPDHCTLTQGFYGNPGGAFDGLSTLELLDMLIPAGDSLIVGMPDQGEEAVIFEDGSESCIIERLPAASSPAPLPDELGDAVVDPDSCQTVPGLPLQNDRFANNLLGQAIALALNTRLDPSLAGAPLCRHMQSVAEGETLTVAIPQTVLEGLVALDLPETVGGLLEMVNRALADLPLGGASAAEADKAAASINELFDQCRTLIACSPDVPGDEPSAVGRDDVGDDGLRILSLQPNPTSREAVSIRYRVAEAGPVRVGVYDVLGRAIRTLVDSPHAPGVHQLSWDGRDQQGVATGSGVYFVRADSPRSSRHQRLLVIR
jgi:hypothetical protein